MLKTKMQIQEYLPNVSVDMVTFQLYPDSDTFEFNANVSRYRIGYSRNKSIRILSAYGYCLPNSGAQLFVPSGIHHCCIGEGKPYLLH